MKIAVIGAGISGLATAYYIKGFSAEAGLEADVAVFEKEARAGGKIATVSRNGYLLETGPNGFLDSKKPTLDLAAALRLKTERSDRASARRYIYDGKKLMRLPGKPLSFMTSPVLSIPGKLRVMMEPLVPARKIAEDESVASFAARRLGAEALERLVAPMVSGIYAGDPERLSLKSAFPRMVELESAYGSLIKAMARLRRGGAPPGALTSFTGGMGGITGELAAALGASLRTEREVGSLERSGGKWLVGTGGGKEDFDAVVTAVPAYVLGKIFPAARPFCETVYYPPLAVVHLGYKRSELAGKADGFGFLTTRRAGTTLLGAIFSSNIFGGRAPEGFALVTAMVGGANAPRKAGLPDGELAAAVSKDLEQVLGLRAAPDFARVFRHERAIPNYPVGYPATLAKLEVEMRKQKGIFLAGNAFYGVGVNDAALVARRTARRVVEHLREEK